MFILEWGGNMSKYRPPDCSALCKNGKCTRLKVFNCQGEECTFKRDRKGDFDSIQCANQRISSLEITTQIYIAQKYYGGSMQWNKEQHVRTYK